SVTLTQLRFTSLAVTSSWRDFHPQECAHAGRTTQKPGAFSRRVCRRIWRFKAAVSSSAWARLVAAVVMFGFNAVYVGCHDHGKTSDAVVDYQKTLRVKAFKVHP
ncbi:hypothetical protein, partial [Sinorhizobium meliloti]|uniref:hypothetical protein n=1 Tax=Rhizobium meliloti TaxID=382 RepID=UPI0013E3069C